MRVILKVIYAPMLFVAVIAGGVVLIDGGGSKLSLIGLALIAIAIAFVVERLIPYRSEWNDNHNDRGRDVLHGLVNEGSAMLSVMSVPLIASVWPWSGWWPSDWPLWGQLAFAIAVADAGITLAHYASHKVNWLWRLHAVHHSVKRMYGFNGLMKHPVHQTIETVAGTTPLVLLGMPVQVAALLAFAVVVQLVLQHSNADLRIGLLRHIWAVAPLHRFHHLNEAGAGDVNFGLFTTLWDRLLGTAYYDVDRQFVSDNLGIAGKLDYPRTYLRQLVEPFKGATSTVRS